MLNEQQIVKRLFEQPGMFKHYFARKEYLQAALCADWARMVALFIQLDEEKMRELFGDKQADEPVEGLIDDARYTKACEWCIFRGGYDHTRHILQNVQKLR